MSKMKSKFRAKQPKPGKPSAAQTWYVDVNESEAGWGMRREERLEFSSEEQALAYVREFNAKSSALESDSHFFHAVAFPKTDV